MRVLVTSPRRLGHVQPLVPLARALVARGNEVLWALPPEGVPFVEGAGLRAVPVGLPGMIDPRKVADDPALAGLSAAEVPEVLFAKLFAGVAAPLMLTDMEPLVHEWRPELLVADAAELAGHLAAIQVGIPSVTKGFGPLLPEPRVAAVDAELAPLWRSRGIEPRPYGGSYEHLYLDVYPPEMQAGPAETPHVPRRQLLRPVSDDAGVEEWAAPPLPEGRPGAPLVYLTMGTVFNAEGPLRTALAGLAGLDVRVLVTVGPLADPGVLGAQPAHVRVERYVPQSQMLASCDAVVSHGGSGTVLATLAHGLPQLCLPQGADQFLNAVERLLVEDSFRRSATSVAASIEAMPSADDVAAVLEALAWGS